MPRARERLASTAPRTPRIVTTRTPLFDEAGWRDDGADLGEMRSGIFLPAKLDDPNRVEMAGEIRAFAQRVWRCFGSETVRPWAETLIDVSRRQSAFSSWKGIGLSPQFMNNYCISLHGNPRDKRISQLGGGYTRDNDSVHALRIVYPAICRITSPAMY